MSRTPSGRTSGKVPPADTASHPAADATPPPPAARGGGRRKAAAAPEPAAPVASQVQIDIDPTVSSGFIFDRYDLLLRGRAVSATPVEEIALKLDDAVIGRVEFGAMDSAVQGGLPEDGNRTQYVFYLNVPLPRAEAQRKCTCILAVRTSDGHTHEVSFRSVGRPVRCDAGHRLDRSDLSRRRLCPHTATDHRSTLSVPRSMTADTSSWLDGRYHAPP